MNPLVALAFALGLVVATTIVGLVIKARAGRLRSVTNGVVDAHELPDAKPLGSRATLLQFSTEFCAPCRATHRLLERTAASRAGVVHLDVDLTDRRELARRFSIMQTPTTLLLDGTGAIRVRIGGAPRQPDLVSALDELIGEAHVTSLA